MVGTDGEKEKKLVVWFTNDERGLVLNKTNNRTIRGAFGDDIAGWVGKIIVVFPTMADIARQDGAGPAGAHSAAEAGSCRQRPQADAVRQRSAALPTQKPTTAAPPRSELETIR